MGRSRASARGSTTSAAGGTASAGCFAVPTMRSSTATTAATRASSAQTHEAGGYPDTGSTTRTALKGHGRQSHIAVSEQNQIKAVMCDRNRRHSGVLGRVWVLSVRVNNLLVCRSIY